jgi:hypothetical protein
MTRILGVFLLVLVASIAAAADQAGDVQTLFKDGTADAIRITVLSAGTDGLRPVDPARVFRQGDRIRVAFESNFDGHVYVVNVTPGGQTNVLFPYASEAGNLVTGHTRYELPRNGFFEFDAEKGTEVLQVYLARRPIASFEAALKSADGKVGVTAAAVATELAGGVGTGDAATVPDGMRARRVVLAPGRDREKDGTFVAISIPEGTRATKETPVARLENDEFALVEIRLAHE